MKRFQTALPFLLALLIVSAGFFGSGAAGRLLPDYTGQVFSGDKQEGIQNAFFSGTGNETLVYPWNLFDRSACLTLGETGQADEGRPEAAAALSHFLNSFGEPFTSIDWETRILVDPKSELVYLPETQLPGDHSISMALDSHYICYLHQSGPGEEPPVENPSEKVRGYVEDARRSAESAGTASSPEEESEPAATPYPEDAQTPNLLLDYLHGLQYMYKAFSYDTEFAFSEEEKIFQIMNDLVLYADYTTLSREGETLIAFSQNRRGSADSLVLYYQESLDAIVGFSLQLGD